MQGKKQKLYAAERKRNMRKISFKSFKTDLQEMKKENFMKECITLRWAFNQELWYVRIRLGT
jgi:hypothetical protein